MLCSVKLCDYETKCRSELSETLLERWKSNWVMGHEEMTQFVKQGSNGFNWDLCRKNITNLTKFI